MSHMVQAFETQSAHPSKTLTAEEVDAGSQIASQTNTPGSNLRPKSSKESRLSLFKRRSHLADDVRRDSGMAASFSTTGNDVETSKRSADTGRTDPRLQDHDVPNIVIENETLAPRLELTLPDSGARSAPGTASTVTNGVAAQKNASSERPPDPNFKGIMTDIPTGDIDDPFSSSSMSFSNRGSVLMSNKRPNELAALSSAAERGTMDTNGHTGKGTTNFSILARPYPKLSAEEQRLSQRVRMMYDRGDDTIDEVPEELSPVVEGKEDSSSQEQTLAPSSIRHLHPQTASARRISGMSTNNRLSYIRREPYEAAGGIEDWRDVNSREVDRYGFIAQPTTASSAASSALSSPRPSSPTAHQKSQRSQGGLETVEEQPSSPSGTTRGPPPSSNGSVVANGNDGHLNITGGTNNSRPSSRGGNSSIFSTRSKMSTTSKRLVRRPSANKGRRWADDACQMLADSSPGALNEENVTKASEPPRKREHERKREAKWQKMAKPLHGATLPLPQSPSASKKDTPPPKVGGGTTYIFDTHSPKVISRTWKGIPDRWRASAWYSFLLASAKRQLGTAFVSDEILTQRFLLHQDADCADDTQIDMDVPRTIGGHIMFRSRYRGGQRLLFRVLHALALEYVGTGYVQGMAPLAATLLCYYDEEQAFVMAARMWRCRGLETLYRPGFEGLMSALDEFEKDWLSSIPAAKQLDKLMVTPTSYGTKWYLTLFSYSLPYTAQLRVWDVFMLLGDGTFDAAGVANGKSAIAEKNATVPGGHGDEQANFDVLHAVSAALIDSMQEALLGSDFENAMKCLTSHVPIVNDDVLMKIARKEWKEKKRRRKT